MAQGATDGLMPAIELSGIDLLFQEVAARYDALVAEVFAASKLVGATNTWSVGPAQTIPFDLPTMPIAGKPLTDWALHVEEVRLRQHPPQSEMHGERDREPIEVSPVDEVYCRHCQSFVTWLGEKSDAADGRCPTCGQLYVNAAKDEYNWPLPGEARPEPAPRLPWLQAKRKPAK